LVRPFSSINMSNSREGAGLHAKPKMGI
jgi:hypothetical protein